MSVSFTSCQTLDDLESQIGHWLRETPAMFCLICGILDNPKFTSWCGVLSNNDEARAVILQSSGYPLLIATPFEVDPDLIPLIWQESLRAGRECIGINGPESWVRVLEATSKWKSIEPMGIALHHLVGEPQLLHPCDGKARTATADDAQTIFEFMHGFHDDVDSNENSRTIDVEEINNVIDAYMLWEVDGEIVSMCKRIRPVFGGCSIGAVYTPPQFRGKGYASAVVHALCEQLLREGVTYIALYTDLANPTSNKIYHQIGFRKLNEQLRLLWDKPS